MTETRRTPGIQRQLAPPPNIHCQGRRAARGGEDQIL